MRFDQMHTNSPGGEVTGSSLLSPYNTQEKTPTPAGQFQCWFSRQRGQRKKKKRRATHPSMGTSRQDLPKHAILIVCAPLVLEKIGSERHTSQGLWHLASHAIRQNGCCADTAHGVELHKYFKRTGNAQRRRRHTDAPTARLASFLLQHLTRQLGPER